MTKNRCYTITCTIVYTETLTGRYESEEMALASAKEAILSNIYDDPTEFMDCLPRAVFTLQTVEEYQLEEE